MIGAVSNNTHAYQTLLRRNLNQQDAVLRRLATGRRINTGSDDPAGLIAALRLQAELAEVDAESRAVSRLHANANIADGHLAELSTMAGDLRVHALASANQGAMSDAEIAAHQLEIDAVSARVQRTVYDAADSLDGLNLPDGGNAKLAQRLQDTAAAVSTLASGEANEVRHGNFAAVETVLRDATAAFAEGRGIIGSYQRNELEPRLNSAALRRENLLAAHSRIVDADFAEEAVNLARAKVLTASSIEVLRIADHNVRTVLDLLK